MVDNKKIDVYIYIIKRDNWSIGYRHKIFLEEKITDEESQVRTEDVVKAQTNQNIAANLNIHQERKTNRVRAISIEWSMTNTY